MKGLSLRRWPRSLFGRLMLILFSGLLAAQALSFGLTMAERGMARQRMMFDYLSRDIASSIAILERVPASERPSWLARLERPNYRYLLMDEPQNRPPATDTGNNIAATLASALEGQHDVTASASPVDASLVRLHLKLSDGTPLIIAINPSALPLSHWLLATLALQFALLAACSWFAVRLATQPLARLAHAADALKPDLPGSPIAEDGPHEVARAAVAFNAMQRRIADYLAERMQILAAVSHDLQTPITRMRLRVDLMDDPLQRDKLHHDLDAMQELVHEGIAYARSAGGIAEKPCRTDMNALLDSLVCDYRDAGWQIGFKGHLKASVVTRPKALRRIVCNLLDNALKFGQDVEIELEGDAAHMICIRVQDRGPGIPPQELQAVLQPFYRIESSRNRSTGGTGLGLAIAQQLTQALGGHLVLRNREGGGLEAQLSLP